MPRGKVEIDVNTTQFTLALDLKVPIEHYYIANLGNSDVILSHDGTTEHDIIAANKERYYDFDLEKAFYFKAIGANSRIRLVWW